MKNLNKYVDRFLEDGKILIGDKDLAKDVETHLKDLGENLYIFDLGNKILIEKEIEED
jgi:hypothetical protein